ncbi:MAG TPA: ABC transporter substrate-binding protein [Dehalococcoidia bacterium]|nr:ABC transporter substrate-binding protein [Dehalococcoidia bacterium]
MNSNYWTNTLQTRLTRRRALIATGGAGLGAAFLAACGGNDGGDGGTQKGPVDTSGLLYHPVDTTKSAVNGGIWSNTIGNPIDGFTPYIGGNSISLNHVNHIYQRLLSYKNGENAQDADGTLEGDAAASWEVSPDHLQITFKLRQNNKYDPRPPTSSRPLKSSDVKYSWEKLTGPGATSPNGKDLANNLNPDAVITSVTFPDDSTVVMKLKEPAKPILGMIAYPWYLNIMPVEAGDKFDVKSEARGTGPFMLTKAEFGQRFEYRRNPNYWKGNRPFLDGIDYTIIPQTPTVLAQFKAKHLWGPFSPTPDSVLATKKDSPETLMRAVSPFQGQTGKNDIVPSKLAGSVFEDIRLRRAISMLLDRDAFIDTFGNTDLFRKAGVPVETGWHDFVPVAWKASGEWQDPKEGKGIGPELSKYYHLNPDEAAKLIRATGKYPLETEYTYSGTPPFGTDIYKSQQQVVVQMLQNGGHIKFTKVNTPDHATGYDRQYNFGHGQYEGMSPQPFGTWPEFSQGIFAIYMPGGRNDYVYKKVPRAHELALAHRREFDRKKELDLAHQWNKAMNEEMPVIPLAGTWTTFAFHWPWLANVGAINPPMGTAMYSDVYQHYWYDKSKDTSSA